MLAKANFSMSLARTCVEVEKYFFDTKEFWKTLLFRFLFQADKIVFVDSVLVKEDIEFVVVWFWLDLGFNPVESTLPVNKSCDHVEEDNAVELHLMYLKQEVAEEEEECHILVN